MKQQESTSQPPRALSASLTDIIKGFLRKNQYLHEFRIQKLIYLAELISVKKSDTRLTTADFKPYMYGSYSSDISTALKQLKSEPELETKRDLHHGKVNTVFLGRSINVDLDDEAEEIIEEANQIAAAHRSQDLGDWSKQTWLYQSTPYGDEMNFEQYLSADSDQLDQDIQDLK
jgi:uncharacterized protein YwgA